MFNRLMFNLFYSFFAEMKLLKLISSTENGQD